MNWREMLVFPLEMPITNTAKNLILKFCTSAENRIGRNGVDEIKAHQFFKGLDWINIRFVSIFFDPFIIVLNITCILLCFFRPILRSLTIMQCVG